MPDRETVITNLRRQVETTDRHTEPECTELLKQIASVLLIPVGGPTFLVRTDQYSSAGRTDLIVIAENRPVGAKPHFEAYVWELKAPQVELFELKTRHRACPTPHLHSAEDQLLDYRHTVANDLSWCTTWSILSHDRVRFGGIVIGREANVVKCEPEHTEEARILASKAREIREIYFYRPLNIRLLTWDNILEYAERAVAHERIVGREAALTDVTASRPTGEFSYTEAPTTEPPEK